MYAAYSDSWTEAFLTMNNRHNEQQQYAYSAINEKYEKNPWKKLHPGKTPKNCPLPGGVNHPCEVYLYVVYHAGKADFPGKFSYNGKMNSKFCSRKVELNVLITTQLRYFKL